MKLLEPTEPLLQEAFPFETDVYRQCWWNHLAPKFDVPAKNRDLLLHRKPVLKGAFKLNELRVAGWNNAWAQDFTPERFAELEEMTRTTLWDCFRMTWMDSRRALQAFDLLEKKGYEFIHRPAPVQYIIDLGKGYEGYLAGLSHNSRKSLKKKTRRAQHLNPQLQLSTEFEEIEAFFAEYFEHHIPYWDAKGSRSYFHDPEERSFIIAWAKAMHAEGKLELDRLLLDGQTASLSIGVRCGGTFYWLLTINTGVLSDYVPGIVGLNLRLQHAAGTGITRFNMGAGDYFFKVQSANAREICHELVVFNPGTIRGRLFRQGMLSGFGCAWRCQPLPNPEHRVIQ